MRDEPRVLTTTWSLDHPRLMTYSTVLSLLRVKRMPPSPSVAVTQQRVAKMASPMRSRHFPISVRKVMVTGSSSPSGVSGTFNSRLPPLLTVSMSMWMALPTGM